MLLAVLVVLLAGGVLAFFAERIHAGASRVVAFAVLMGVLGVNVALWVRQAATAGGGYGSEWSVPWIPRLGVDFHLAADGLSLTMLSLTVVLGFVAVACSVREVKERVGLFHLCVLLVLTGVAGVFLAADLVVFYLAWELMLLPMYVLIRVWGHEDRRRASVKFFLFTQAGGVLLLVAILALHELCFRATGVATFDPAQLKGVAIDPVAARWVLLGFLAAFLVKLPAVPLHPWLPDAHTQAPTAGSVLLAGLLLKTAGYGLMRFAVPLLPDAARFFAPAMLALGVAGILYGAMLAFGQQDLKRLVAMTSVSHLGFVLLGVFTFDALAWQGAVLQMVCHGLSTGALFVLAGILMERTGSRELSAMGGLRASAPRMASLGVVLALASLGLPGLGNFVAEFLVLVGTFRSSPLACVTALLGLVLATVYALAFLGRVFDGRPSERKIADLSSRELLLLGGAAGALMWIGLAPTSLLGATGDVVTRILAGVGG